MSAPELAEITDLQEVETLSESPGARRALHTQMSQQQQETAFGANVETVEAPRRSSAPPGGSTNNIVEVWVNQDGGNVTWQCCGSGQNNYTVASMFFVIN